MTPSRPMIPKSIKKTAGVSRVFVHWWAPNSHEKKAPLLQVPAGDTYSMRPEEDPRVTTGMIGKASSKPRHPDRHQRRTVAVLHNACLADTASMIAAHATPTASARAMYDDKPASAAINNAGRNQPARVCSGASGRGASRKSTISAIRAAAV